MDHGCSTPQYLNMPTIRDLKVAEKQIPDILELHAHTTNDARLTQWAIYTYTVCMELCDLIGKSMQWIFAADTQTAKYCLYLWRMMCNIL